MFANSGDMTSASPAAIAVSMVNVIYGLYKPVSHIIASSLSFGSFGNNFRSVDCVVFLAIEYTIYRISYAGKLGGIPYDTIIHNTVQSSDCV